MKKAIAVILCLTMLCAVLMTGCGIQDILDRVLGGGEQEKFVGRWTMKLDMTDMITEMMGAEMAQMGEYFVFEDVVLVMNWEFEKDGTYSCYVDSDELKVMVDNITDALLGGLEQYLTEYLADYGFTLDDYLQQTGISLEDLAQEMDIENTMKEAVGDMNMSGRYKVEDGKLYTNDDVDDTSFDEEDATSYSFNGKNIELDAFFDEEVDSEIQQWVESLLPLVLEPA